MGKDIILADNAGFCFGVKRAVESAINTKEQYSSKVYTLGPLIHNNDVVTFLLNRQIVPLELEGTDELHKDDIVIIRSHGVSPDIINLLEKKGAKIIDATCPYVSYIQKKVKNYYDTGYNIIVVGDKEHPEVKGINGWCENKAIITKNGEDIEKLPNKVCVVSQTTEKQENWIKVMSVVSKQCKEIIAINTICSATETRQKSADEISKKVDVMFIIGSKSSSNTTKLYEICKNNCSRTFFVENGNEIPDSVLKDESIKKIGVTAGASTPDWIIKEAISKMSEENKNEFNEQLDFMEQYDKQIAVGQLVKGEVISINDKEAFLNIGYKADGLLPLNEYTREEDKKLTELLSKGDVVEAKVISRRNEDGYVVLSKIELEREEAFGKVKEAFNEKLTIKVKIKAVVKGGVTADYKGCRIFIPASHLGLSHVEDLSTFVGESIDINIIELDESKRYVRIIGSRKDLLLSVKKQKQEDTWSKLEKDMTVEGEVVRLTNFGAFVDIEGVDGLLHISELSWGRVTKPSDVLKVGDKVKAKIININKETEKLSLSIKALQENPWDRVEEKYPEGSIVLGKVVRFADFGAFIELEPGIDALAHISEISENRINKPSDALQIGEQVKAKILDVKKEEKKIGISIKAIE